MCMGKHEGQGEMILDLISPETSRKLACFDEFK